MDSHVLLIYSYTVQQEMPLFSHGKLEFLGDINRQAQLGPFLILRLILCFEGFL